MIRVLFFLLLTLLDNPPSRADQYHYKDVLIGDRAAGMGGAYNAISDDPSGMFYNPAGIVFAKENYLSLSVNAFSSSTETFENIVPGKNYTYRSSALSPTFFGYLQEAGRGKFGFSVIIPNSDSIDQNDSLSGLTNVADQGNIFQRRFLHKDNTYLVGPTYAQEVFKNFTAGISLPLSIRTENIIDNQFAIYNPPVATSNQRWFFQESYRSSTAYALRPKIGFQYMPIPKLSIGLTMTMPVKLGGSGEYTSRALQTSPSSLPNGVVTHDIVADAGSINPRVPQVYQLSLGVTKFVNRRLLFSTDFDLSGPDAGYNNSGVAAIPYAIRTTWNVALGTEWYLADALALRAGFYTNRSNSPKIDPNGSNQPEHVDQYCGSLGFSFYRAGTSLSLTGGFGMGKGSGQGVGGTTNTQTVTRSTTNILLSGSYQM